MPNRGRYGSLVAAAGALGLGVATIPLKAEGAQMRPMALGHWSGGSFSDDTTQKFSHCSVGAPYKSGITMFVAMNRNWGWTLGFINPVWNLQTGSQVQVQVAFDGGAPYAGTANVIGPKFVGLPMAPASKLIQDFRMSRTMTISTGGMNFPFVLTSTSKVMLALAACVKAELAYEQGGSVPDLGLVVATLGGSTATIRPLSINPATNGQAGNSQPAYASPDRILIATQIASNLLLQAKLPNARLLTADETPDGLKGFGVAWVSDQGTGAVKILDAPPGQTGQDIASQLIASDASTCKGDFASGRSSDLVDNSIVTKAFVACKEAADMKSARYLIYQGGTTHFVVFDTVAAGAEGRSPSEAPPTETRFQAAALRAVSYQTWK